MCGMGQSWQSAGISPAANARIIDGKDMIAMPGFVETHWHLWNSSLRALIRGDDPKDGYFPLTLRGGPAL